MSNRAVEDAAIAFVIEYEAERGRVASDTRGRGGVGYAWSGGVGYAWALLPMGDVGGPPVRSTHDRQPG
jgi:hypothetical protein